MGQTHLDRQMKILVVNRGSSSVKCALYDFITAPDTLTEPIWEAKLEWKGQFEAASLVTRNNKGCDSHETISEKTAEQALSYLVQCIVQGDTAILPSLTEINVVGHRIAHGGSFFKGSVLIDKDVKEKILSLADLAPLHNPPELECIAILEKLLKGTLQIAVFDTAFHHTLPVKAKIYPGPYKWYQEGIQRYGFHGISFQYCLRRSAELLHQDVNLSKTIICHLGSGASLCAAQDGRSIDTTMGFTPLEGLMMDTRSGTIDPGILLYLMEKKGSSAADISKILYQKSGLLGLSGFSSDMREIIEAYSKHDVRGIIAFDTYVHRLNGMIGSMIASLQGLDTLIFTAGIGENSALVRTQVCHAFSFLGLKLEQNKNEHTSQEDCEISSPDSTIKVFLIHTQEAFEIAKECWRILED